MSLEILADDLMQGDETEYAGLTHAALPVIVTLKKGKGVAVIAVWVRRIMVSGAGSGMRVVES